MNFKIICEHYNEIIGFLKYGEGKFRMTNFELFETNSGITYYKLKIVSMIELTDINKILKELKIPEAHFYIE